MCVRVRVCVCVCVSGGGAEDGPHGRGSVFTEGASQAAAGREARALAGENK